MRGWKSGVIKDYGKVITGHTPPTAQQEYSGEGYKFVTPTDLNFMNYFVDQTGSQVTEAARKKFSNKFLPPYSVSYTCIGNTIGKSCLNREWVLTNQQMNSIIPSKEHDYRFIYYQLNCLKDTIVGAATGAATPIINKSKFESIKVKYPPLPLQQKIGSLLAAYDDLIENNLKRIKLLEEMAQITYEEWFVRLRFPGHETTPINAETSLPEGWCRKSIKDIGDVVTGKTPSTTNPDYFGSDIPFIKTPDMADAPYVIRSEQSLSRLGAESQKKKYLPKNSLMVSCIGTIGVSGLVARPSQTNQQINSIVFNDQVYVYFMYCFSRRLKPLLEGLGSNGATMMNVNKGKFEAIEFDCPTSELLDMFHTSVLSSFDLVLNLQYQNQRLREARDILLPRLMTGMIDVESYDPVKLLKDVA